MTYDVSMDVKLLYKMVEDAKKHYNDRGLLGDGNVYYNFLGFGHVGDGVSVNNGVNLFIVFIVFYIEPSYYGKHQGI